MTAKSSQSFLIALLAASAAVCAGCSTPDTPRVDSSGPVADAVSEADERPPCDASTVGACVESAADETPQEAEAILRYGCDHDDLDSCVFLGQRLLASEPAEAGSLYRRACRAGYAFACVQYGNLFMTEGGPMGERDFVEARKWFEEACAETKDVEPVERLVPQGQEYGCTNLGMLYENGWGVERDLERAYRLSKFACDRDFGNACNQVGVFIGRGWVDEPEATKLHYHLKACEFGDGPGCCNAASSIEERGEALEDGRDAAHFLERAREHRFDCENWHMIHPEDAAEHEETER